MGRYMGIYGLTSSFGWSAGPFLGGVLLDLWGDNPPAVWGTIAGMALVSGGAYWLTRHGYPDTPGPTDA